MDQWIDGSVEVAPTDRQKTNTEESETQESSSALSVEKSILTPQLSFRTRCQFLLCQAEMWKVSALEKDRDIM